MIPSPSKRRFQFGLRTLLAAILMVSAGMGWIVHERRAILERQKALRGAGYQLQVPPTELETWGSFVFGYDEAAHAGGAFNNHATDENLSLLTSLNVWWIDLDGPITDAGLSNLKGMKKLIRIKLHNTDVTDDGVAELQKSLPKCEIER